MRLRFMKQPGSTRSVSRRIAYRMLRRILPRGARTSGPFANELQERCLELLAGLVLQLDRFQVRTLDAFFAQIGHLFAFDLGLPAGWSIADSHQLGRLNDEAIGRVLADVPAEQLLELLRGVTREEGARRSVRGALHQGGGHRFLDHQQQGPQQCHRQHSHEDPQQRRGGAARGDPVHRGRCRLPQPCRK